MIRILLKHKTLIVDTICLSTILLTTRYHGLIPLALLIIAYRQQWHAEDIRILERKLEEFRK